MEKMLSSPLEYKYEWNICLVNHLVCEIESKSKTILELLVFLDIIVTSVCRQFEMHASYYHIFDCHSVTCCIGQIIQWSGVNKDAYIT